MPGSKALYFEFCSTTYVPLHLQPWWLDAVCGPDAWGAAVLPGGILPYFKARRWGLPVIQQPPLTSYTGPWLLPPDPKKPKHKQLALEHRVLKALMEQIPQVAFFYQCFRPELKNWLPFYWSGFRQTLRYSYMLPAPHSLPGLYSGLKGSVRSDLRRAGQWTEIVKESRPEPLFHLHARSYARKNLRPPYTLDTFSRLHQALAEREQAVGFLALDRKKGTAHAGLYLVFDEQQAAVLLTGFDPEFAHSGALNSLYWEAVCFCAERQISLDFEGSMQPGIERVFRAFGAQLSPYFCVWRTGNKFLDWLY